MTALAQARLLLLNDLRRLRWLLAAYVALILMASVGAIEVASSRTLFMTFTPMLVLATGCAMGALAVLADSPFRADAFWMSRPLSRGAVLGAKLAIATVVITVALTGAALTFVWIGFGAGALVQPLVQGALVYWCWMLFALTAAALSRDLRGFLSTCLVLAALFVASTATRFNFGWAFHSATAHAALVSTTLLVITPAVVLALVYLRRDSVAVARTVGILAFALILIVKPYVMVFSSPRPSDPLWLAANDAPNIAVKVDALGSKNPDLVRLQFRALPWRNADYMSVSVTGLVVFAHDGARVQLRDHLNGFAVPVHDSSSIGSPWHGPDPIREANLDLSAAERSALASGIERVEVTGFVYPYAAVVRADLPFATGSRTRSLAPLILIDSITRVGDRTSAKVSLVRLRAETDEVPYGPLGRGRLYLPRYVLLNDLTHAVSPMEPREHGTAGGWVVVPGARIWLNWAHVELVNHNPRAAATVAGRAERLRFVDWESLGWGVLHSSTSRNHK